MKKMTTTELFEIFSETFKKLQTTLAKKNNDYAGGKNSTDPLANFRASEIVGVAPERGILIRTMDKMARINTFVSDGELKVADESVEDACDDIIGYTILLKALLRERRREAKFRLDEAEAKEPKLPIS